MSPSGVIHSNYTNIFLNINNLVQTTPSCVNDLVINIIDIIIPSGDKEDFINIP